MPTDLWIDRLAKLFAEHPAWREAARLLHPRATSTVFFRHRPGEPWHLERRDDETLLLPGAADDPDFAFRFTPAAIDRLAAVRGNAGDFAAELFALTYSQDPEMRVSLRVAVGFARLLRRGYVRLLLAAGPRARAIGFANGETGMSSLPHLVGSLRRLDRATWEKPAASAQPGTEPASSKSRRARKAAARASLHNGW
jgi:hypothetical protein